MPSLQRVLARPPATTLVEVVARLEALEAALPADGGLAWFTRLYHAGAEALQATLRPRVFADPRFVERLDVVFANVYFTALAGFALSPRKAPRAWAPLVAAPTARVAPIQLALCGMNAHVNRGLPVALVQTALEQRVDLEHAPREHGDFSAVNGLLAATETAFRERLASDAEDADRIAERIAMWDVGHARETAWVHAEILARLHDEQPLRSRYLAALDRAVGFAGRGLLVPL